MYCGTPGAFRKLLRAGHATGKVATRKERVRVCGKAHFALMIAYLDRSIGYQRDCCFGRLASGEQRAVLRLRLEELVVHKIDEFFVALRVGSLGGIVSLCLC